MAAPIRVQLRRTKGWRMPAGTVKVDRSTAFGNPFLVERMVGRELWDPKTSAWVKGLYSVRKLGGPWFYEAYFRSRDAAASRSVEMFAREVAPDLDLPHLRGQNLACWCALPEPGRPDICHAAVLLELANAPVEPA